MSRWDIGHSERDVNLEVIDVTIPPLLLPGQALLLGPQLPVTMAMPVCEITLNHSISYLFLWLLIECLVSKGFVKFLK